MISVITPVYNGEKFIETCIKVVIEQNCPDVEHIIMDAGSKDGTVDIIKEYAEKYPHIRWISEKDKGQSDAMNKGIAMAKGEILGFLNVDDYYEPNVLNKVVEIFKSLPEPSFIVANCNVWNNDRELESVNKPKNIKLEELLLGPKVNEFPVNPTAYFYHTSVHEKIGLYDINEHYAMDIDFIFRVVQVSTIKYIDETWGNHLKIEGTKTVNDRLHGLGIRRVYRLIKFYRKDLPLFQRFKVSIGFSLVRNIERIIYFSTHPEEIFSKIKEKMMK
ncbi:glycosyltransferase family 2 protein [Rivularia sp. UHCC 0363]|uniref:glycosyltransferase family 2 protein n=1 Tax=Rivularia sp. UHCC 0363 TaxID=3110244 RepID=UPI002B1EF904|nr:glycosyltransferase family 2 protein [Rivularia sp. UHCC 0363]MEA5598359.1 glycosyltransferase family 2 protein [Rivularia sp. UHCC 0363]